MFTGLVREVGQVASYDGGRLVVESATEAELGDSVAIDGVCLTVVETGGGRLAFDAVPETLSRTSLRTLEAGSRVNLEPALRVGEALGGHYVQGHVDGVCRVRSTERDGESLRVTFEAAPTLLRYVVEKGSVAVQGVALTVTHVDDETFGVALIPFTLAETTLGAIAAGDELNLEVDVLAKYVERLIVGRIPSSE